MHLEMDIKEEEKTVFSPTHTEEGYGSDEGLEPAHGGAIGKSNSELKRPDLKGSFRCGICAKVFCHSSSLSRHRMQAHFKSYRCTVCRKDISSSESLRTHMFKQHHISRMYMCRCCNWAFPDKSLLHIHLQSTNNNNNNNNNSESMAHSVINRSCHVITDPFQLIRAPLVPLPAVDPLPVSTVEPTVVPSPDTSSWLSTLPKPVATTIPIYLPEKKDEEKYTSQSPTCSFVSFKSDLSAFHQLSTDRSLIASPIDTASPSGSSSSSRISPRHECFDCHVNKAKVAISESRCKYLEARVDAVRQETVETSAQMNGLEQTVLRLRMEAHVLREHNELFQRKLLECQSLAVGFLQSEKASESSEVNSFLRTLINNTILTQSV